VLVKKTFLLAVVTLAIAAAAQAGGAKDDERGVDCFYAENRDEPLCREGISIPVAPPRSAGASLPLQSAAAKRDDESIDCFYAENREHPFCR
jgi:hypothetical protein